MIKYFCLCIAIYTIAHAKLSNHYSVGAGDLSSKKMMYMELGSEPRISPSCGPY